MTYEEQIKIEYAFNERISNVILIFLLLVRLLDYELAVWVFGANVPDWIAYWYSSVAFILTALIIWLNRHRLATLNIDRPFIGALIIGGAFYALRTTPNNVGALVGIVAGLIFWAYSENQFVFRNPIPYPRGTGLLILFLILLALAPVILFPSPLKTTLSPSIFITTFLGVLQSYLMLNVFEEVIFRGALWAYLQSFGLSERVAFLTQAILFWVAHHRFLLLDHQYSFWVATPCVAILLGLLAWRSKSLTPSLIGHFLFNFITQLLITIF